MDKEKMMRRFERSREASLRRDARRKREPLTVGDLLSEMRDYCDQLGLHFFDTLTTKETEAAGRWLKAVTKEGHDSRKILREVCEFWPHLKLSNLKTKKGRPIILSDMVSFSAFYFHRREILEWIEGHRDDPKKHKIGPGWVVDSSMEIQRLHREREIAEAERKKRQEDAKQRDDEDDDEWLERTTRY